MGYSINIKKHEKFYKIIIKLLKSLVCRWKNDLGALDNTIRIWGLMKIYTFKNARYSIKMQKTWTTL